MVVTVATVAVAVADAVLNLVSDALAVKARF